MQRSGGSSCSLCVPEVLDLKYSAACPSFSLELKVVNINKATYDDIVFT